MRPILTSGFGRALTLISIATPLLLGYRAEKERLPKPDWVVEYQSGTLAMASGTKLRITIASKGTFSKPANIALWIPLDQLASVYFEEKERTRSADYEAMPRSGCHYAESRYREMVTQPRNPLTQVIVAVPTIMGPINRTADKLVSRKPIGLFWKEGTTDQSAILKFNQCEYAAFIGALQAMTGPNWTNLKRAHSHP